MSTPSFPYETRLNVYYQPLEVVDEKALAEDCVHKWYNQTLCKVNESVVRLGVVEGEYHWHKHDEDDEFFYVVEGKLYIDLQDRSVELAPRQGFVVPKGVTPARAPCSEPLFSWSRKPASFQQGTEAACWWTKPIGNRVSNSYPGCLMVAQNH